MDKVIYYILSALAVLVTLTVHEFSHGLMAYKLGDNTARNFGRLTLNPIKHIDPVGALCMLLFHFGWAKPVPINLRNFRKPRRDFALTALAGPASNIILAFFFAFPYLLMCKLLTIVPADANFLFNLCLNFTDFLFIFHYVNIGIAVFNLIPVPPLDGSRIVSVILPPKLYFKLMKYERITYIILIVWLLLGEFIQKAILSIPFVSSNATLTALTNLLSLSDIIRFVISLISNGFLSFFSMLL